MSWEYVAGFVDGEGSIIRRRRSYVLLISQTNLEVLEKIRDFVGKGSVYPIKKRKSHWKDAWVFSSRNGEDTYYILKQIADRLVVKKKQAFEATRELEKRNKEISTQSELRRKKAEKIRKLRERGLTYREIGKILNMDFGYARRLARFGKEDKWWA